MVLKILVCSGNTKVSSNLVINNFVLPIGEGPYTDDLFASDSTEYQKHYLGNQFLLEKMGNSDIPPKETTGPIRNENGYTQTFDDPRQLIKTYQINHFDMNPKARDREGYVVGDNFRDERVTHYHFDPYQVNLRARHPFFDDATHDNKTRLQKQSETY